jgi:hypothetical protein
VTAHGHARPHVPGVHVSPFGRGAVRSARHAAPRPSAVRAAVTATKTLWVSNSVPVGHDTSCTSPGFSTISAALAKTTKYVNPTIKVCAGTYTEQLVIKQPVVLKAQGAVTVVGPSAFTDNVTACDADGGSQPNEDVVDICGSIAVTMSGFTIEGNFSYGGCYDSFYGVAVLGGATLNMSNSTVENIREAPSLDGCQGGVGIEVGLATGPTTADPGTATLSHDTVETYQKNGITVDGANSSATIGTATVTGDGPNPNTAQNGIQVSDGAGATITGGTITGDECSLSGVCGPDGFTQTQACGLLMYDSGPVTVSGTTVSGNDIGVYNGEDFAWNFYTPPSPFNGIPVTFTGLGLANRYENAYFDQGESTLNTSQLSGGVAGVEVPQYSGQTTAPNVTMQGDTINGTSVGSTGSTGGTGAILVASDGTSGDQPVVLSATGGRFGVSNTNGVVNNSTSVLTATGDYWGKASGPSGWSFGTGASVSSDVNFFPWETNSALTRHKFCTTATTDTTTGNDVVLCARTGKNAYLANGGTGNVLLLGNASSDQLVGSSTGETWIIGGTPGNNLINGNNGTGFIQERGNGNDTLINADNDTVAAS